MGDVHHFKSVNDTFGHAAGDQLLQRIAHAIVLSVRPSDPSFRLGGEEFLVLLSNVDAVSARHAAERIRDRVARWALDLPIVTVSGGLALRQINETRESLLARADAALYRAKENGRDRVEVAP
jgi:diguanylate cyclase (GGDEF)-like protein